MSAIQNRLQKNLKRLKPLAEKHQIEAFRLYDRDIPEFPSLIDIYSDHILLYDRRDPVIDHTPEKLSHFHSTISALKEIFQVSDDKLVIKSRQRQKGESQYERMSETGRFMTVRESQALFQVNLFDYLDTGLFLDHRLMRQKIFSLAKGKDVLNLFSYTGSVSVFAALGDAKSVTSIDLSKTYTEWAQENFKLNKIKMGPHRFLTADVLQYLGESAVKPEYDLIFLDPPTFSNSKKMEDNFEVEREDRKSVV